MYCESSPKNIGLLYIEKSVYDLNPTYQRQSGLWSREKCQLFIDSIFNRLDVPKIYMHDLRDERQRVQFAVIDGKQRLTFPLKTPPLHS